MRWSANLGNSPAFLRSPAARALTAVLMAHALLVYGFSREEHPPPHRPLREFPVRVGSWALLEEGAVGEAVQEVLRADETLTRTYRHASGQGIASLFVAYFRSQRTGVNPHSPKNCLPGSGWYPVESGVLSFEVGGRTHPVRVNRYIVAKGDSKSLVLYWYQTRDRVIASEYAAKVYLVADALRYNRTDTALVRIAVPVAGDGVEAATRLALDFARETYLPLRQLLPP
jgi:EpsI family protein